MLMCELEAEVFCFSIFLKFLDCSQSPNFPCDRRVGVDSLMERNWGEYKMPVGRGGGGHGRPLTPRY